MNSKKNKKESNQELYRICPSKLTKHELEDLYFTVLESNMQLRKTINDQEDKIRRLSSQMQRKYSAQKVFEADERNNCCVSTNLKVKQQKESLDKLRRAHDKTAERIRTLNIQLSSGNTSRTYPLRTPSYSQNNSKLIRYTPSTLKQQNISANYKVSEDTNRNNEKAQYFGNQTKWTQRRFSQGASKPRSQSKTSNLMTGKEMNNKKVGSVGTLTDLVRDKTCTVVQTEPPPCCSKRLVSAEIQTDSSNKESSSSESQTELPSNNTSLPVEIQTELPSNNTSLPVEIQTELPRDKITNSIEAQTEQVRDQIMRSKETQSEPPRDDTSETASIQTQTTQEKNDMCKGEYTSIQSQTAPENDNANKCYAVECRQDSLCNENKCRTTMDELRQKINNLVEELAKTHNKYSSRISRLEVEVQEYRNEIMCTRLLGHPITGHDTEKCSSFMKLILSNLRAAESYGADLKMQLAIEKKKVSELISLIRDAKMRQRMSNDVTAELDAKKSKRNLEDSNRTYNCSSDCPIAEISSKHKCTVFKYCKRGKNHICCRIHDSPLNSIDSEYNIPSQDQPQNLQSQNTTPDFKKYKSNTNETQSRPVYTNVQKDDDLPNPSKPSDSTKHGLCNIYSNENIKRPSAPDAFFDKGGIISNGNNIQDLVKSGNLPDADQDIISNSQKVAHLCDDIRIPNVYNADGGEGLPDSNYLDKIHNLPDGLHSFCVPEVTLNDNDNRLCDNERIFKDKNEQEIYGADLDKNNTSANEQQFDDAFECRDKPSLLVKSLIDINEEQSKTVTELMRQLNDSQRSMPSAIKQSSGDNFKRNDPKDLTMNRTQMTLPQDTTGLMRVISTHADDVNESNVENIADDVNNNNNNRISIQSSDKYRCIDNTELRVPEETMSMLRMLSTFSKSQNDEIEKADSERNKPTTKERNRRISQQIPGVMTSSIPNQKICKTANANIPAPVNTQGINKAGLEINKNRCREAIELATKHDKISRNIRNVPTKDNDTTLKGTVPSLLNLSVDTLKSGTRDQATSVNDMLYSQMDETNKTSDKDIQVRLKRPEKLETRNDLKDANTNPMPTQLEIATYRRNSGTLCFKTIPVSKRSQHCQCTEQFHCEGIKNEGTQTEKEIEKASKNIQGTCTTGCSKCTRNFGRKSMDTQGAGNVTGNAFVPAVPSTYYKGNTALKNESKASNNVPESLTNKEQVVKNNVIPRSNNTGSKHMDNNAWRLISQTLEPSAKMQDKYDAITEELARVKKLLSERTTSVLIEATEKTQTNLQNNPSDEVVNEFDAGRHYVLKPGMAMHTMNENNTPKCVFVLHIGTVVLSDEAVLTSRGKSLALTWKFYDQDTTMTHMRAGRVVVFDFSTEYDLRLTDEFLNYMKHDELKIIICEVEDPNKPIASCSLPLRDALLNTNRRADMSLALVAGPQMVYARQANKVVSDKLDTSDEMGVLDLWCMLRAEGQFLPRINKAIAGDLSLSQEATTSDFKRMEKQIVEPDLPKTENIKMPEKIRSTDDCTLRRWGSSALRLPSKDLSRDLTLETNSAVVEDWAEGPDDQASFYSNTKQDSTGFKTANTVEIDHGARPTKRRTSFSGKKLKTNMKHDANQSRASRSTAVQYDFQDDDHDSMIVNEVIANIKTSDDMKRVMNDAPMETAGSVSTFTNKAMHDDIFKNKKSEAGQEPTVILPRNSTTSKRSDVINQKYHDITNLYPRCNLLKNEGSRSDQSRKQVTIANHKRRQSLHPGAQRDIPEEEEQIIEITVLWLALNEECEAMLNPRVQRVYVAYEFLGRCGADLETPVSLPKPKHYVDKCYFNFKKSFQIEQKDMPLLGQLARCRATSVSQISTPPNDCVVFSVISEPPEDPLGVEICEDIGYAYLYLGDLLAYSNGSTGYTEVIPVRARSGTSVCGVLAVRLDGLNVLRQSLALVDKQMMVRAQNRQA